MMTFLEPYLGIVQAVAVIAAALALFGAGYHVRDLSADRDAVAVELDQNKAQLRAAEAAITKQTEWTTQQQKAENDEKQRRIALQAAADNARKSAVSLRQQLADNERLLSSASAEAVRQYAAIVSAVLTECADQYRIVAKAADSHASDVQTLMDAWPK
jgi:hypothetical protein